MNILILLLFSGVSSFHHSTFSRKIPAYLTASLSKGDEELNKIDHKRRRTLWLERYGTFEALQVTFGTGLIGDMNPDQTRRLYHTILSISLLGLYESKLLNPEELALLAYKARIASKEYSRSRCTWTSRLLTDAFEQYRDYSERYQILKNRGRLLSSSGFLEKYEAQIVMEEEDADVFFSGSGSSSMAWNENAGKYEECIMSEQELVEDSFNGNKEKEALGMRIYLRILERSFETSQDGLFLKNGVEGISNDFEEISSKLEIDIIDLLGN